MVSPVLITGTYVEMSQKIPEFDEILMAICSMMDLRATCYNLPDGPESKSEFVSPLPSWQAGYAIVEQCHPQSNRL